MIIHGHYPCKKVRGCIGDICPNCGSMQALEVTGHYDLFHIYFVPIFPTGYKSNTFKCPSCKAEGPCQQKSYSAFVSTKLAQQIPLAELIRHTNPQLSDVAGVCAKLEAHGNESIPDGDLLSDTLPKLMGMYRNARVPGLLTRLNKWPSLSERERRELAADIDRCSDIQREDYVALQFLRRVGKSMPESGYQLLAMTGVALVAMVVFFLVQLPLEFIAIAFVGGLIAGIVPAYLAANWAFRRWVRSRLIPKAEQERIEFTSICSVLRDKSALDKTMDAKLIRMNKKLRMLVEVLLQEGKLPAVDVEVPVEATA